MAASDTQSTSDETTPLVDLMNLVIFPKIKLNMNLVVQLVPWG